MSENTQNIPDALSTVTPLPAPKPGQWDQRNRRARSRVRGTRANTLPPALPGEVIFRVSPDSKVGRATLRAWGRRHGYDVKDRGKIPREVRDAFMKENDIWTVKIITMRFKGPTGKEVTGQYYQVKQGSYVVMEKAPQRGFPDWLATQDIKRLMGDDLFYMLKQVKT